MIAAAVMCLALNVFHEARGEPLAGQIAVAQVTINRAKEQDGVCSAVFEDKQFSWVDARTRVKRVDGKVVSIQLKRRALPNDERAWASAVSVAAGALAGVYPDYVRGAKFYHEKSVRPDWLKHFKKVAVIGNHVFYKGQKS
ncbi:cell wall hydrolase [Chromobacterium sp. ASV23]|uniref:cell wall hydrolase n=1 Tax=Chromobacterium sp. ASV23 TaxID=2795110 RepID=UPI0018EC8191|nr:cell wall hydrolase [Chromobacterium sp. ASV23]